jgi:hypothetical protein
MGRYYSGDIEGKFWFGLQPSDAPSRFGATEQEPCYITYSFEEYDLEGVEEEIQSIEDNLGDKISILDKFFEQGNSYNDDILEEIGVTNNELRDYADLKLGIQIRDCIKEQGYCIFDAEI